MQDRKIVISEEAEELLEGARTELIDYLADRPAKEITDNYKCRSLVRDCLSDYFWKNTKRKPMILPVITEV